MSNESDDEEFSDFSCSSGHPDIALAVYITKRLQHIIGKYFLKQRKFFEYKQEVIARTPLGRLIKKYSYFGARQKHLEWSLMTLVQKRNDLVHNIEVNNFESESDRKMFVEQSNRVLQILSKARQPEPYYGGGEEDHDITKPRMEIKEPGEYSSDDDILKYHCWYIIKKDPVLQKSISDDEDGLFKGLLPISFEEYLAIVPRDDHHLS